MEVNKPKEHLHKCSAKGPQPLRLGSRHMVKINTAQHVSAHWGTTWGLSEGAATITARLHELSESKLVSYVVMARSADKMENQDSPACTACSLKQAMHLTQHLNSAQDILQPGMYN